MAFAIDLRRRCRRTDASPSSVASRHTGALTRRGAVRTSAATATARTLALGSSFARAASSTASRSTATAAARAFSSTPDLRCGTIAAIPYRPVRPLPMQSGRVGRPGYSRRPRVDQCSGVGVDGRGDTGSSVLVRLGADAVDSAAEARGHHHDGDQMLSSAAHAHQPPGRGSTFSASRL